MLIQMLCVPECRNCQPAIDRVRQVLQSEGVDSRVEEVLVAEEAVARSLHFPGSPTVRVNGVDVERAGKLLSDLRADCTQTALDCRRNRRCAAPFSEARDSR